MASTSVRKNLANNLLRKLSAEQNKVNEKTLKSRRPQVLFLDNLQFVEDTIKKVKEKGYIPESVVVSKAPNLLKSARSLAKNYQDNYISNNLKYKKGAKNIENTAAGQYLKIAHPDVYSQVQEGSAFVFSSFRELGKCKETIISLAVNATDKQLTEIIKRVDRGHGAGAGFAVSQVTGARALGQIDDSLSKADKDALLRDLRNAAKDAFDTADGVVEEFDDIEKLTIDYKQIVTPTGRISVEYIPFITFQDKYTNRVTDGAREKRVLGFLRDYFEDRGAEFIANLPGSSTLIQKASSVAIKPLLEIKTSKSKVTAAIDPKKVKLKSKGSPTVSGKSRRKGNLTKKKGKAGILQRGQVTKAKQSTVSVAALMGLMNARINDVVANNMGPPGLENRTGRFAGSVRITDVVKTRKGFPSIGYTYQRDPYQVYESTSGSRFSSLERDPRLLIDKSIRELAAELAIGRIYTRRV